MESPMLRGQVVACYSCGVRHRDYTALAYLAARRSRRRPVDRSRDVGAMVIGLIVFSVFWAWLILAHHR